MLQKTHSFKVLCHYKDVRGYVDQVRAAADKHKEPLGFLAGGVYEEFARKECLYVLVTDGVETPRYVGHLLFTARNPRATVVQMYTELEFRRSGAATFLLDHFKAELTNAGFTSIYAGVADNLEAANKFWERQKFYIQATKRGGAVRKRTILRRCHELDSPQLLARSGIDEHNPLGLQSSSSGGSRLWLIDLNVVFDVSGPRRKRHDLAVSLFQAEQLNLCKLAISDEMRRELKATAAAGKIDPMEGFIDILRELPLQKFGPNNKLLEELHGIIFPGKTDLSKIDKSDIRHVATAIQHGLAGLITNDETLLNAAQKIQKQYGIELISPAGFLADSPELQATSFEGLQDAELILQNVEAEHAIAIHTLLRNQQLSISQITDDWLTTGANTHAATRYGVWLGERLVGYITWSNLSAQTAKQVKMAVDNASPGSIDAARIMLKFLVNQLSQNSSAKIELEMPKFQPEARDAAIELGFNGNPNSQLLVKVAHGGVLTSRTWIAQRAKLESSCGIKLPDGIPQYSKPDQPILISSPDGNRRYIPLEELESLLAPALFCLPGRPAIITPIKRNFAEPLLGHSPQESLLPAHRVSLYQDRRYISATKNLHLFKRGTLVFFYESSREQKGRGAIVALARIRESYIRPVNEVEQRDYEHSVLNEKTIQAIGNSPRKTVAIFDNIFILPRMVQLDMLRELNCGSATQLLSTNQISDAQAQRILQESFSHG